MKTVILAGGLGTRLAEETDVRPKPMVEIGGKPILWHIMKHYAYYGFDEFFIALGYKGDVIRKYFLDYALFRDELTVELGNGKITHHEEQPRESWTVHLIETGDTTNTGGRLLRLKPWLEDSPFFVTYGDGVCNIDLRVLLNYHRSHGCTATVTAVHPPARFGGLTLAGDRVTEFAEKSHATEGWINGGFFVFEPRIFDYLDGLDQSLETDALTRVARDGELRAYRHDDFWQCMDTLRDVRTLQDLWSTRRAPWRLWD